MGSYINTTEDYGSLYGVRQGVGQGYGVDTEEDDQSSAGSYMSLARMEAGNNFMGVSVSSVNTENNPDSAKDKTSKETEGEEKEVVKALEIGEAGGDAGGGSGGQAGGIRVIKRIEGNIEKTILIEGVKESVIAEAPVTPASNANSGNNYPQNSNSNNASTMATTASGYST
ncbi:MAG: hypothetical protein WCH62_09420 [Candidatus Omnitrophota bacterium]